LKLITKVFTLCSKPEKLRERVMFIHFYLVDVRHFQNYIVVHFLTLFRPPFGLAP